MMEVDKVINNNLVRSHKDGCEVLVMGKGLGFKKSRHDAIDEHLVEKIYVIQQNNCVYADDLLAKISYECIQTTNEIIDYVADALQKNLADKVFLGLADHINFALERAKKGIKVQNALLWEIKHLYNHEYLIAKEALRIIARRHAIELPEDEAGFLALHFINAQLDDTVRMEETMQMTQSIQKILDIVKFHYGIELNEHSIHYERFVTHLKYFWQRLIKGKEIKDEENLLSVVQRKYPEEYACAQRIESYIQKTMQGKLTADELVFLTVHIRRVVRQGTRAS